jgi:hypothetical protein
MQVQELPSTRKGPDRTHAPWLLIALYADLWPRLDANGQLPRNERVLSCMEPPLLPDLLLCCIDLSYALQRLYMARSRDG